MNFNAVSMNVKFFGVAKWSTPFSSKYVEFGNESKSFEAGAAKSFSPITTRTGQVISCNASISIVV